MFIICGCIFDLRVSKLRTWKTATMFDVIHSIKYAPIRKWPNNKKRRINLLIKSTIIISESIRPFPDKI
jgi:hypothetical protein